MEAGHGVLPRLPVGLYKIFVDFEAVVHKSTILSAPPSLFALPCPSAILLHDYWTVYDSPSDLPFVYAIHQTILVILILCKGQVT